MALALKKNLTSGVALETHPRQHSSRKLRPRSYSRFSQIEPKTASDRAFLQKDPDPGKLRLPATVVNAYTYVVNNPINLADPMGLSIWSSLVSGLAWVAGAVVVAVVAAGTAGIGAILLGAVVAGMAAASFTAFLGGDLSHQLGTFANAFAMAGAIGMGGFAIGALAGATAGAIGGAVLGAGIGGYVGY